MTKRPCIFGEPNYEARPSLKIKKLFEYLNTHGVVAKHECGDYCSHGSDTIRNEFLKPCHHGYVFYTSCEMVDAGYECSSIDKINMKCNMTLYYGTPRSDEVYTEIPATRRVPKRYRWRSVKTQELDTAAQLALSEKYWEDYDEGCVKFITTHIVPALDKHGIRYQWNGTGSNAITVMDGYSLAKCQPSSSNSDDDDGDSDN
jgi:hypothetical protein